MKKFLVWSIWATRKQYTYGSMFFLSQELQAEVYHFIILSFIFLSFSAFTEEKRITLNFNSICIHLPKYYRFWRNMMKHQCIWKPPSTIERWTIFCNLLTPRSSWLQIHVDTQNNCHKTVTLCVFCVRKTPKTFYHSEERRVH